MYDLRVVFTVAPGAGKVLTGKMDIVDQNVLGICIDLIEERESRVCLNIAAIKASYRGELSEDGTAIRGNLHQSGVDQPLILHRVSKAPGTSRPQDPKEPYEYDLVEAVFQSSLGDAVLRGTFSCPKGDGPFPAIVLLSGSGPQDRDAAILGHRPFLVLADHLTRNGNAVLRYDDRGVGMSSGNFAEATHGQFVADAMAALAWLKEQRKVDRRHIGLIGHSEGCIVAAIVTTRVPDDIRFMVTLAGPGIPMHQLLVRQCYDIGRALNVEKDILERGVVAQREVFSRLLKASNDEPLTSEMIEDLLERQLSSYESRQREAMGISAQYIEAQKKMLESQWFQQLVKYDPHPVLQQIRCPVLAINGERDLQVSARENLDGIRRSLEEGGNRQVYTLELPGLNHLFQTTSTGTPSEYGMLSETISPTLLNAISKWIATQVR